MNIEHYLQKWKSESFFGERHFKKLSESLVKGQSLYLLSYKVEVKVEDVKKTIEKNKFFQTQVQYQTENEAINLNADNYVCQQILNQLEIDFFKDYNEFIDGEVRKKTNP